MTSNIMINYWEYLVLNIVIKLQHIGNFFFFVSVNIVIKLFAKFFLKKLILGIFSTKYCD